MSSVKQYIKNPKFGQGDEPEFLPVGATGIDAVKNRLLQVERQALNITIRDKKNYASLTEAIAAVTDDKYKVKGFQLQFSTDGKVWKHYLYNGDDASGWSSEDNWLEVTYREGGSSNQYLDLSMFSEASGTLSDEDYQKIVKAYEDKVNVGYVGEEYNNILITYSGSEYTISSNYIIPDIIISLMFISVSQSSKIYSKTTNIISLKNTGSGTKALTDNGRYSEFASPIKTQNGGTGAVTKELQPNTFYKFRECSSLTITLAAEKSGILNEYMFEFISGSTSTTLADIPNIKWQNGEKLAPEANCTYQVSIVNNCAVYAKFPNA